MTTPTPVKGRSRAFSFGRLDTQSKACRLLPLLQLPASGRSHSDILTAHVILLRSIFLKWFHVLIVLLGYCFLVIDFLLVKYVYVLFFDLHL